MARKPRRYDVPLVLEGAADFRDENLHDPEFLFRLLERLGPIADQLARDTTIENQTGPRRTGSWAKAYMGFTISGKLDIKPWWRSTTETFWKRCGFEATPAYMTVWENFALLEGMTDAFEKAAATLIQGARAEDPNVGAHLHVDGAEVETSARLRHDCLDHECPYDSSDPIRITSAEAGARRNGEIDGEAENESKTIKETREISADGDGVQFTMNGHVMACRDASGGMRAYKRLAGWEAWFGFNSQKMVDHYTGACIANSVITADQQEYDAYADLLDKTITTLGDKPLSVVADRGYSVKKVFETNTDLGIDSVMAWRGGRHRPSTPGRTAYVDEDNVPICKSCGGGTKFVRFVERDERRSARVYFRCEEQEEGDCLGQQSIACAKEPHRILALWPTSAAYQALMASHSNYERVHRDYRRRYRAGGKFKTDVPRRIGVGVQALRHAAALMIDWLRICWNNGWVFKRPDVEQREPSVSPWEYALAKLMQRRNTRARGGGSTPRIRNSEHEDP